ncbi:MAG: DUF72 domain-containing protein [bacterium]
MKVKIGCCGFSEAHYKYFKDLDLVELQNTFFQPPSNSTANKLRDSAPQDFEFTLKAWQLITHKPSGLRYKNLREPISQKFKARYGFFNPTKEVFKAWEVTRNYADRLKAKCILFESANNFHPTKENIRNLRKFFNSIKQRDIQLVWEPRRNWDLQLVKDICEELNLVHAVDPFQNESVNESFKYYRLQGLRGYHYKYSDEELRKLKDFCSSGETVFCLFNNVFMKDDALRFKKLINS